MRNAARRYTAAGAALATAGVIAVSPAAPQPSEPPLVYRAAQLTAGESLLNVPFNLFQDIVNIPNAEIEAINALGESLIFSGTWYTASATNIWGEDTGDPAHFMGVISVLVPIKEISGLDDPLPGYGDFSWDDAAAGRLGLAQQIILLANAEVPASASSVADWSAPLNPTTPITGFTQIDRNIWFAAALLGIQNFPLYDNWFQVPLSDLMDEDGYTFGTVISPSRGVGPNGEVPDDDVYGIPGTISGVDAEGNPVNLMPWSNQTFKLDPSYPFANWFNSLQAEPDLDGFEIPSLEEAGRALQTLAAGALIGFYPYVPGSPNCAYGCDFDGPLSLQNLVQATSDLWPGNTAVEHWLDLANQEGPGPFGMANGPTWRHVAFGAWQNEPLQQWFDVGNPSPADPPDHVETPMPFEISPPMQNLIDFMEASGVRGFAERLAEIAGYTSDYPEVPTGPDETIDPGTSAATTLEAASALREASAEGPLTESKEAQRLKKLFGEPVDDLPGPEEKAPGGGLGWQARDEHEHQVEQEEPEPKSTELRAEADVPEPEPEPEREKTGTRINTRDLMQGNKNIAPGKSPTDPGVHDDTQGAEQGADQRATSSWKKVGDAVKRFTGKTDKAGTAATDGGADTDGGKSGNADRGNSKNNDRGRAKDAA